MRKIHQLPPLLVAKIAAGEVIERPAFAVKELIENAIDANAGEINVFIEKSGLKKIQVSDNGEGMSKEDLRECIKPHTTSKIKPEDDLIGIKSLGFRGEALASIASVSHLKIKSRTSGSAVGTEIEVEQGKVVEERPVGMPVGTIVLVENLFSQIPARKKFLKTSYTELRHIIDVVSTYALAYPSIRFTLKHNKRILFNLPRAESRYERMKTLFGADFLLPFIPLNVEESYISISGFIATPFISTISSSKQYIFVNNRKITSPVMTSAIRQAYGTLLDAQTQPIFLIFLDIPYELVDVNIHPRKERIGFANQEVIIQIVKKSIENLLETNTSKSPNILWRENGLGLTSSYAAEILKDAVINVSEKIVQFYKCYIALQTKQGIVFIDQHAAHERILYERIVKEFKRQKALRPDSHQESNHSDRLQFSTQEMELLREQKNLLEKLGFNFKINNDSSIQLTGSPLLFQDRDPKELITLLLEDFERELPLHEVDRISQKMMMFLACRAAVKAGDTLAENQMKNIVKELEKTEHNITCPHGRPTKITLSLKQLHKLFKR